MRIFLADATGAIGRRTLTLLGEYEHEPLRRILPKLAIAGYLVVAAADTPGAMYPHRAGTIEPP